MHALGELRMQSQTLKIWESKDWSSLCHLNLPAVHNAILTTQ